MTERLGEIEQLEDGTWHVVVYGVEYVYQTRQQAVDGNMTSCRTRQQAPVEHRIGNRRHGK